MTHTPSPSSSSPSYAGVPLPSLLLSVRDAVAFLKKNATGELCRGELDTLGVARGHTGGFSLMEHVGKADNSLTLKSRMVFTGMEMFFSRFYDVLAWHGMADTDGRGRDVFNSLQKWSAMTKRRGFASPGLLRETHLWLLNASLEKLKGDYDPKVVRIGKTFNLLSERRAASEQKKTALHLRRFVSMAARGKAKSDIAEAYDKLTPEDRLWLVEAARHACGMAPSADTLDLEGSGMRHYSIRWGNENARPSAEVFMNNNIAPLLAPFVQAGDAFLPSVSTVAGPDNNKPGPFYGIVFEARPQAAQAVADAVSWVRVMDDSGTVLRPRRNPGGTLIPPR